MNLRSSPAYLFTMIVAGGLLKAQQPLTIAQAVESALRNYPSIRMSQEQTNAGRAQWVDVKRGAVDGDLVEVIGNLKAGDKIVRHATDEMRDGAALRQPR